MTTSQQRHPSRDALLRDALGQLCEQKGVQITKFARVLNGLSHAMCSAKTADMPALDSFVTADHEYDTAVMAWNKRVQRWANGSVEFPAWLEEAWVTALEQLGDEQCRVELARRHGFMGVRRPVATESHATAFAALGAIGRETGEVMESFSGMLEDGVLDENDAHAAPKALQDIDDAITALLRTKALIETKVSGKPGLKLAKA